MAEQDLCANCGNWRELHYATSGTFIGDKTLGCFEYQGTFPTEDQREKKTEDISNGRKRAQERVRRQSGYSD